MVTGLKMLQIVFFGNRNDEMIKNLIHMTVEFRYGCRLGSNS